MNPLTYRMGPRLGNNSSWDKRGLSPKRAKAGRARPRSALPHSHTRKPPEATVERAKVERRGTKSTPLTCLRLGDRIGEFLELGNKETVHVVGVRVEAAGGAQGGVEAPFPEAGEALLAEVQARGHQPHVPFSQGIVYHPLVLFHLTCGGDRDGRESGAGAEGVLGGASASTAPSRSTTGLTMTEQVQ